MNLEEIASFWRLQTFIQTFIFKMKKKKKRKVGVKLPSINRE